MKKKHVDFLWDANTYDKVTENLEKWGVTVIKSKKWDGNETVLDAGCGSGKVTKIFSLVTKGKIYAVDKDPNMIKKAGENLQNIKNVKVVQSDLLTLNKTIISDKINLIFSNAVLHWIDNHYRVFQNFRDLLFDGKEYGGELLIQCGGYGNLQNTISILDEVKNLLIFKNYFLNWKNPWYFANPSKTEYLLTDLGYRNIKVNLFDVPVVFPDKERYLIYLKTVVLGPYLKQLSTEQLKEKFIREIGNVLEKKYPQLMWRLDYVRLNISASL